MPVLTTTTNAEAAALLADAPSPVVVIAVYGSYGDVVRCLQSVLAHTAPEVSVLVVDDGGLDRRLHTLLNAVAPCTTHRIVVLEHARNQGFVRSCNDAFASTPGRDVVLVNSDVVVGAEWLERLSAAASSCDSVATATTLTNHGTIVSVPHRNQPGPSLPDHMTPAEAARRVAAASCQVRPEIPTGIGHCLYLRRPAIDLVGPFDETFTPGYGEEVDFCQRAVAQGFRHVVADDVFTFHRGAGSFGERVEVHELRARHDAIVRERYPWYESWVERAAHDTESGLADALSTARRALTGTTVGIDARCLGPHDTGTQRNIVESIRALARRPEISRLVVLVPSVGLPALNQLRDGVARVELLEVGRLDDVPTRLVDLMYRPYQVGTLRELDFLRRVGDRLVINQLDTIAYDNPAYFPDEREWAEYREALRVSLSAAHGIAFLSDRAREAAVASRLVRPDQPQAVVWCGADELSSSAQPVRPLRGEPTEPFLLCLGASFLHKNRRFAIEVWAQLRRRGWDGRLVLAGPTPTFGHSLAREAEFLLSVPDLQADVVDVGAVTEGEKRWLYEHAALVLYPSTVEGFGLVPFEAARHGAPTLAARRAGLRDVLPPDIPAFQGFDVVEGADRAWKLLHDSSAAAELTDRLRRRADDFTWSATAERLVGLFAEVLSQPAGRAVTVEVVTVPCDDVSCEVSPPICSVAPDPSARAERLEHVVHAIVARPSLKHALSPAGSRRQRVAREVIGRARRRLI